MCSHILRNVPHLIRSHLRQDKILKQINFVDTCTRNLTYSKNLTSCLKLNTSGSSLHQSSVQSALPGFKVPIQCRMSTSSTDHVRLWKIERLISAALPIVLPASLILENPAVDSLLAVLVVMHTHWGLEAIIVDYARPIVVGPILPKVLHLLLNLLSVATLAGLLVLVYNGPGIAKAVKNMWAVGEEN